MIRDLLYDDDGKLSRSSFIGVLGFCVPLCAVLVCTGYVVYRGIKFDGYAEFLGFASTVMLYSAGLLLGRSAVNAVAYAKCEDKEAPKP